MKNNTIISIMIGGLVCFYAISCKPTSPNNPMGPNLPKERTKTVTISGKVSDSLTGLSISALIDVTVLLKPNPIDEEWVPHAQAKSNQNGEYSLNFKLVNNHYLYELSASRMNYETSYYDFSETHTEDTHYTVDFKLVWLGPFECAVTKLLSPRKGDILDNGRTDGKNSTRWWFDWLSVDGATKYNLYVIGPNTNSPLINVVVGLDGWQYTRATGFIPNKDRLNWRWRVRAYVNHTWCDWSKWGHFNVEPVNTDPPNGGY